MVAVGLRAVEPDGLGVLDDDLEHVGALGVVGGKVEPGEEARVVVGLGVHERLAGVVEGRLGHRVVLGRKVPLDHVAHLGHDVVGLKAQGAAARGHGVRNARPRDGAGRGLGRASGAGRGGDGAGDEECGGESLSKHVEIC